MTNTERLISILPEGHENAMKRRALAEKMDMADRAMRQAVMEAKIRDRVPICNFGDGKGYFVAKTPEESQIQYRIVKSYAHALLAQLKTYREGMGMDGQITLDELLEEA